VRYPWAKIDRRSDRDYLDGMPIHCGDGLELRGIRYDENEQIKPTDEVVRGRYELSSERDAGNRRIPMFYTRVGGYEMAMPIGSWMLLRWPERS